MRCVWRAIISSSLVGINPHPHADCRRADARPIDFIGGRIELDAEPGGIAADPLADCRCVSADASGEHQRVEPAEGRRERAVSFCQSSHSAALRHIVAQLHQYAGTTQIDTKIFRKLTKHVKAL
jgi:hypothetical protein